MRSVVIIGAGECGVRAAFALRESGFDGEVTLVSDETHLPYERPPLSKSFPVAAKVIVEEQAYAKAGLELVRGRSVRAIDRMRKHVVLTGGESLNYDRLLIASGARPRILPGMKQALTLRTLGDAQTIIGGISRRTRLVIIGGGFIGLELAATARGLAAEVTVVESADRLMGRAVPVDVAAVAERRHRDEGVEIVLSARVVKATENRVELEGGRIFEADMVVAGVGAQPETRLAEAAGLEVADGIVADGRLTTSDQRIFAAGDCCSFPFNGAQIRLESWRCAQDQGAHAARSMLGAEEAYACVPWFWSDQYDLTLQVAGLPRTSLGYVRREISDTAFILFQTDKHGALVSACGIGPGHTVAKDIRVAELMMERCAKPDPEKLADPAVNLKSLLKG